MSFLEKLLRPLSGSHAGRGVRSVRLPPPRPNRSLPVLGRICRQHGGSFEAALHGEITADEYIAVTENNG